MSMGSAGFGAAFLLCLPVFGCGPGSGGSIPSGQLGSQYAAVFCHRVFTCCEPAERSDINANDEATCRTLVATDVNTKIAGSQASIDAGRINYHGDLARRCVDTLGALSCAQWSGDDEYRRFPECLSILEGTVMPGGACTTSEECRSGSCDINAGTAGTCVARAGLGESCATVSCLATLACQFDTNTCMNPLPDGSPCVYNSDCTNGFCGTDASGARSCASPTTCNGI
jgi:hypothetical protein